MRERTFTIVFWLTFCLVALTGCKLPGGAFVGKWDSTHNRGDNIEISRTSIYTFDVVRSTTYPVSSSAEDTFATCGDALCIRNDNVRIRSDRLRFPEKGNPDLLLDGQNGDDSPNYPFKVGGMGEELYKRVE